jgi:hypothetical protein
MNTYHIPKLGRTYQQYADYCASLAWALAGDAVFFINYPVEQCSANGTLAGFEQVVFALDADKVAMTNAIKAERDRRKLNGVLVSGKWIHTDVFSRTQWMAMVMMGASIPAISWTTMDGTQVTTSQALAGGVFSAVATLDATVFAVAASHIAAMEASDNPMAYNFSAGWPATFGE